MSADVIPGRLRRRAIAWIVFGGCIAATLDIVFAFVFYGMRGVSPLRILQSIASGVLGRGAYDGGAGSAALGLVFHFLILIVAAFVFCAASRKWRWLVDRAVAAGIAFGIAIYAFMNLIVLPLSAFPHKIAFPLGIMIPGLLAHMFLVGLPIALAVRAADRSS